MIEKLLIKIRSIIEIDSKEADCLQALFKPKFLKKGDFFLDEGQVCKHAGFITKGLMRYYINHDGEEQTYDFAQENDFICNYESFIPKIPSTKIIQALEDCEILQISYDDLQTMYTALQQGERLGRLVIEQVFIHTLLGLSSFYTDTPELRYKEFVKKHPQLQQRLSQYHIASYVGVKPQSLSRIRKRMYDKN
ncbi:cAMP-binding domain of CRP or a regulatory subunit of cAMP-dependent protein kinases [Chryseobacterium soldanellicola]|uniref:cAMP-binding domain of CRP or a regulatory subunit of cAMP-dependent protein kinases n=1 Tax=Chryseobacterium soldanellicola TaxID=311333 RepID=A0A1H1CKK8_9FLAO|nr:Crp/Fnr family transcriptional regulator [Chryseobacterium soldanellicola]SDQ64704.1 cAMP-binding domain of CRP or a regulatory subunit of cAMP-dependent protein kinases [Chryseobacterium soldanellicola]